MTPDVLTSARELDTRTTDGIQVRLLWSTNDDSVWVAVVDTKSREAFCLRVQDGESALDVFHHPYAYAAGRTVSMDTLEAVTS